MFGLYSWFLARVVFADEFLGNDETILQPTHPTRDAPMATVPLFEQGEELLALAVHIPGQAGMVEGDDLPQR
jgi:hypothetical protein